MKIRKSRTLRRLLSWTNKWMEADQEATRGPNTAGLKSELDAQQRRALFSLSESAGYSVLLDVLEMACVEQDTKLVNADPADAEQVLAEHRMSKAFWQIFVAIQKKIAYERREYIGLRDKEMQPEDVDEELQDTEILH